MSQTLRSAGLSLGAVMLVALAATAQADSPKPSAGWETGAFDRQDGCFSAQVLPDGVMMGFHYMAGTREFRLTLSSQNWEEQVPDEDTGTVSVEIATRSGTRDLSTKEGYGIHAGNLEAVAGIWYGEDSAAARKAFAAGREAEVFYQGRSLGIYPLDGAADALNALEDCVANLDKG